MTDPKPKKRIRVMSSHQWRHLRRLKIGPCRGCGNAATNGLVMSLHHLVPRSLGGDDVADNLIPLCGSGTQGCHGIVECRYGDWPTVVERIRGSLSTKEVAYIQRKKGEEWLARYYPLSDS